MRGLEACPSLLYSPSDLFPMFLPSRTWSGVGRSSTMTSRMSSTSAWMPGCLSSSTSAKNAAEICNANVPQVGGAALGWAHPPQALACRRLRGESLKEGKWITLNSFALHGPSFSGMGVKWILWKCDVFWCLPGQMMLFLSVHFLFLIRIRQRVHQILNMRKLHQNRHRGTSSRVSWMLLVSGLQGIN